MTEIAMSRVKSPLRAVGARVHVRMAASSKDRKAVHLKFLRDRGYDRPVAERAARARAFEGRD